VLQTSAAVASPKPPRAGTSTVPTAKLITTSLLLAKAVQPHADAAAAAGMCYCLFESGVVWWCGVLMRCVCKLIFVVM
jgi:hypothetical protein